jgi:hypothetical protein
MAVSAPFEVRELRRGRRRRPEPVALQSLDPRPPRPPRPFDRGDIVVWALCVAMVGILLWLSAPHLGTVVAP